VLDSMTVAEAVGSNGEEAGDNASNHCAKEGDPLVHDDRRTGMEMLTQATRMT